MLPSLDRAIEHCREQVDLLERWIRDLEDALELLKTRKGQAADIRLRRCMTTDLNLRAPFSKIFADIRYRFGNKIDSEQKLAFDDAQRTLDKCDMIPQSLFDILSPFLGDHSPEVLDLKSKVLEGVLAGQLTSISLRELASSCSPIIELMINSQDELYRIHFKQNGQQVTITPCDALKEWSCKQKRDGGPTKDQKRFCEILLHHGGEISPADMKIMGKFTWDSPREGAKQMVIRINIALGKDHQPIQVIASDRSNIVVAWKNTDAKKI